MNPSALWYYELGGERIGPVADREIAARLAEGAISPATLVWREGMADWKPLAETELAPAGSTSLRPPPMPPVLSAVPASPGADGSGLRPAVLRPDFRVSIRSTHGRAWALMATRFWPFVGCYALLILMVSVAQQLFAPTFFLIYPLMGGFFWYTLKVMRGEMASIDTLFEGFRRQFGPLAISNLIVIGVSFVCFLVLFGGFAVAFALAVPALEAATDDTGQITLLILGAVALFFLLSLPLTIFGYVGLISTCLILDCGLKAGESLSLAWRALRGQLLKFILFAVVNLTVSLIGIVVLGVGMIVSGAWATLAFVYLYEDAFGEEPAARQAGIA